LVGDNPSQRAPAKELRMPIRSIGVVGAGTMGTGIAQVAASAGFRVVLLDVNGDALIKASERIRAGLDRLAAKGKIEPDAVQTAMARIQTGTVYDLLADSDLVVEAATENCDVKVKIVQIVDKMVRPDAVISSTTSSVSITKLAAFGANPGRFVGMHFFNPVPVMDLVEIVPGLQTTNATHDRVTDVARQMGKTPITVKNMPGFVVNRLLLPMINEAFFALADDDASADEIDEGMKLGCNHPMGPLALADLIGLDVLLSVMEVLHRDFGDPKYRPCPRLKEMVDAGYLGRKSGRGVYRY
jgi:3-hydroxybutyryl-CoA dehydrogenase